MGEIKITISKKMDKITKELKKNPNGFTVSELSKKLNVSRQTVTNCFAFLEGARKVNIRQVGMAKIYFWEKNLEKNDKTKK